MFSLVSLINGLVGINMKKIIISTLLTAFAQPIMAEWQIFATTDNFQMSYEDSSIKKDADLVRVWANVNFREAQEFIKGKNFYSSRNLYQIDCTHDYNRIIHSTAYTNYDGKGDVVTTINSPNSQYEPIIPGTIIEYLSEKVCD